MHRCPVCDVPLCRLRYEGVWVRLCPDCKGALVGADPLRTIERKRDRSWTDAERAAIEKRVAEAAARAAVRCPRCLAKMAEEPMPIGAGSLRVDHCAACRLYWLDPGELELAQILFEDQEDGRTDAEWEQLERRALAELRLEDEAAEVAESAERRAEAASVYMPSVGDSWGLLRAARAATLLIQHLLSQR